MQGYIPPQHPDYNRIRIALNNRKCPDCGHVGFSDGPGSEGSMREITCNTCKAGFVIAPWPTADFILRK